MVKHQIFISIGSNVERDRHIRGGVRDLALTFDDLRLSQVYESEAVGFKGCHFYNLVASAETDMPVQQVCDTLKNIEAQHGRKRGEKKFAPRTLDLDLLLYDDLVTDQGVVLPREEILHNAFVLRPLAELAPERLHPLTGQAFQVIWDAFDQQQQHLWPIAFEWSTTPT